MGAVALSRWSWTAAVLVLAVVLLPFAAEAQLAELDDDQPVALVADSITYDAEAGRVIASGNVEVFYGDRTLTAERIVYEDRTGRITAEGDLVLRDPTGTTVFADVADLDAELRDGLVVGARAVLGEHVRLAAVEARRVGDRYNTLSKAVYSPCAVCPENPTPLWRIRARRVIHDEVERIIHYENATFEVFGIPIAWLPYFRHPDPLVGRVSGFLVPSFLTSSLFGYGVKAPYYWVIDAQSDLTFTPFFTTDDGLIAEAEYRRLFESGAITLAGSITYGEVDREDRIRGHLDTDGRFALGAGVDAGWDIAFASDDAYLREFEFALGDRLSSSVFVERYRPDQFFNVSGLYFQSFRDNEPAGQIPVVLPVFEGRWENPVPVIGGEAGLFTSGYMLRRNNGRDSSRFSVGVDWERQAILPVGLAITGFAQGRGDFFTVRDDPATDESATGRFTAHAGVEMRYPLIWERPGGGSHIIEPVVQAIVAPFGHNDSDIPVEDSLVTEFDETNVIDRNHFSGIDSFEEGPRLNLLVRYDYIGTEGFRFDASVGQVYRLDEVEAFSSGSGLRDETSDIVAAWQASYDPYVTFRHRMRFGGDATVTRNELFGSLNLAPVRLTAQYVFLESDPEIGAPEDREEVRTSTALQIDPNWSVGGFVQRDLQREEFVLLGGSLRYATECAQIELFLRRRFTETEDVPASTSFGVDVKLLSLGTLEVAPVAGRTLLGGGRGCG